MSKQALEAIKEAEMTAEKIRSDAAKKRAQMLADEEKRGEAAIAAAEAKTLKEINGRFAALDEATEKLLDKNRAEAEREARDIKNHAKLHLRVGINEIFRGLDRQCQ